MACLFMPYLCLAQKHAKPNVIVIMADDIGYGDLSCYGEKTIHTPNVERLADQGVMFTDHILKLNVTRGKNAKPMETCLYKLTDDVSEHKDLKSKYPVVVNKMEEYIEESHIPMKGVRLY